MSDRRRLDDDGIIGSRPKSAADLGPLFAHPTVEEAERELRDDFIEPPEPTPAPAPRAREETQAFEGGVSDLELAERRVRIQRELEEPLLALALSRRDAEHNPGVVADDVQELARRRLLLDLLGEQQRAWSWTGLWLAELAREGALVKFRINGMVVRRASRRSGSHGNPQVVYLHPYDFRAQAVA